MDVGGFSPDDLRERLEGRKLTVMGKREKEMELVAAGCSHHEH